MHYALLNELDNVLRGSAWEENFGDACFLESRNIRFGDDAAEKDGHVIHSFLVEQAHELRAEGVMRAGQYGQADDINVFLHGGGSDHLRGLAEAGVNHFHSGITKRAGNDFRSAV